MSRYRTGPGHCTVQFLRADDTPFPIVHYDGMPCVVAVPGAVFKLAVEVLPTCKFHNRGELIRAHPRVDGNSVGMTKLFSRPGMKIWEGFYATTTADRTSVSVFQFAAPETSDISQQKDGRDVQEGKVTVHLEWVTAAGPARGFEKIEVPQTACTAALPDGKKFFLAPSLVTKAGEKRPLDVKWSTTTYIPVQAVETLTLSYETATAMVCHANDKRVLSTSASPSASVGTLLLRRVLRHDNPAHRALLDAEAAARGIHIEEECAADGGGASSSRSASGTARPRVKRERGGRAVDLTVGMVARPSVDPSVLEMCDLTADAAAPNWTAKKRNASAAV